MSDFIEPADREQCPNCGSAATYSEDGRQGDPCVRIYECGRWFLNDHERTEGKSVKACELIRSLREERDELQPLREIAERHEWGHKHDSCNICAEVRLLRNNEHRSDT